MKDIQMRKLAILLLDDPHGISRPAYDQLQAVTGLDGLQDIYGAVRYDRERGLERAFLPEDHGLKATAPASAPTAPTPPTAPDSTS